MPDPEKAWTPEAESQLRALWFEGWPTAEIGRRMGITKSAVIGKAGRLNLLRRDNPSLPRTPDQRLKNEAERLEQDIARAQRKIAAARDRKKLALQKRKAAAYRKIRYWTEVLEQLDALGA